MADGGDHNLAHGRRRGRSFEGANFEQARNDAQAAKRQGKSQHAKEGRPPRVAFTGEEFGFGYRALQGYGDIAASRNGMIPGAGGHPSTQRKMTAPVDFRSAQPQPLRTKEQALSALTNESADFALVPFYDPEIGYDTESLQLISAMFSPLGVDQVEAGDQFCLAVYESQVLELAQASHPGSSLARFVSLSRGQWAARLDPGVDWSGGRPTERRWEAGPSGAKAGLQISADDQLVLRDRIEVVFAGPEAVRRCKAKLDGLRAAGVSIEETVQWIEPHREMARRVRDSFDRSRQVQTYLDPTTGRPQLISSMSAQAQTQPLFGVILPFEVACRSPEFMIVDPSIEDGDAPTTRFLLCEKTFDHSLFEDRFKLNSLRVDYWMKRLEAVKSFDQANRRHGRIGEFFRLMSSLWTTRGGGSGHAEGHGEIADHAGDRERGAVRVLMQFERGLGAVTSIGTIEDYLRYYGVRYATVRLGEDSEASNAKRPAPVVLDVEFDMRDFAPHPKVGSVIEGFLWKVFNLRRFSMPRFLAVMPFTDHQLRELDQRRWWNEGVDAYLHALGQKGEAVAGYFIGHYVWEPLLKLFSLPVKALLFTTFVVGEFLDPQPKSLFFRVTSLALVGAVMWLFREPIVGALGPVLSKLFGGA